MVSINLFSFEIKTYKLSNTLEKPNCLISYGIKQCGRVCKSSFNLEGITLYNNFPSLRLRVPKELCPLALCRKSFGFDIPSLRFVLLSFKLTVLTFFKSVVCIRPYVLLPFKISIPGIVIVDIIY